MTVRINIYTRHLKGFLTSLLKALLSTKKQKEDKKKKKKNQLNPSVRKILKEMEFTDQVQKRLDYANANVLSSFKLRLEMYDDDEVNLK